MFAWEEGWLGRHAATAGATALDQCECKCRGLVVNPAAFPRHGNSKVNDGNRTELTANSFSAGCWPISTPKIRNVRNRFPSERLLATPMFLIPLSPPASQAKTRYLLANACALIRPCGWP